MTPVKALNHIGIAVKSIEEQRPFYEETLAKYLKDTKMSPAKRCEWRSLESMIFD